MGRKFTWEGTEIAFPTSFNWSYEDISTSNTGRTLSAKMQKSVVASKRTISCEWKCLPDSASRHLLKTIKGKTYGDLNFPDPLEGKNITKNFYSGTPQAAMMKIEDDDTVIWDISLELAER